MKKKPMTLVRFYSELDELLGAARDGELTLEKAKAKYSKLTNEATKAGLTVSAKFLEQIEDAVASAEESSYEQESSYC